MSSSGSTTIPLLPCESLDATLEFWQALGFAVVYKQRAPNPYAVISYDDYAIHLFGLKRLNPHENFSGCIVVVPDVEQLHRTFAERLRQSMGKVPNKGFPRITRMKPAQTRFTLTDVAGNSVIYVKRGGEDHAAAEAYKAAGQTPLQKALNAAGRLRDFKNDDAMAAKALDLALARAEPEPTLDYARVLAARLELAVALEERERALALRAQLAALPLADADRQSLSGQLAAIDELERSLAAEK
jgi:hypothetical protein